MVTVKLKASTTRAAKAQVKRVHPEGGVLVGLNDCIETYRCYILPQSQKLVGGRTCFSNREPQAEQGTYPKPDAFFFTPKTFTEREVMKLQENDLHVKI